MTNLFVSIAVTMTRQNVTLGIGKVALQFVEDGERGFNVKPVAVEDAVAVRD